MYVIVADDYAAAVRHAATEKADGLLRGEVADDGDVVRLLQPGRTADAVVGRWQHAPLPDPPTDAEGTLVGLVGADGGLTFVRRAGDGYVPQPHQQLSLFADYHSRTAGLFDSHVLATKTVAVIGLGTGGATCATELAKAGVSTFRLVDFDRLEVHNIARHVCGMRDIGRRKTAAVRDHLENTNPAAQVTTYDFDITTDAERLADVIRGCDLVIGATDSESSKSVINRVAWAMGVPAVYGAAYGLGFGGDVLRVLPPDDACYECFRIATGDLFQESLPDVEDYEHSVALPALSLDIAFPALIMARVALIVLLAGDPTAQFAPYASNWVLWCNQPRAGWAFDEPLQAKFIEIAPDPLCPVCHHAAYMDAELGMSEGEAAAEADAILATVEDIPALPL